MNKEMEALIEDINPKEIANHIETDTLGDWCKILRNEMLCTLDKMRKLILVPSGTVEEPKDTLLPSGELLVDTQYANEAKSVRLMDREGFTRVFEEPKIGHWEQERIISIEDAQVSMLQLATCPNCKRLHTTPYRYCFEDYAYCPRCGAKMERSK